MRPCFLAPVLAFILPAAAAHAGCAPVHLTAAEAHQRMMNLLHIRSIRPGFSGSPKGQNPANYDEAKAGPFSKIPDPLVLSDGRPVTTAKMWWAQRRPQLLALFNSDIYGAVPEHVPAVHWQVLRVARELNGGIPIITKTLAGRADNSGCPAIRVDIQLALSTPAEARGPVPVVMNLDLAPEVLAMLEKRYPQFFAHPPKGPTWQQQVLARGWGYASYIPTSAQPDDGADMTEGIIGLTNRGRPRSPAQWGALRAWAWGASRAL
ncbi:MAG: acetylxylan esterase, partial [Opitutaceae bacterium]